MQTLHFKGFHSDHRTVFSFLMLDLILLSQDLVRSEFRLDYPLVNICNLCEDWGTLEHMQSLQTTNLFSYFSAVSAMTDMLTSCPSST